MSRSTRLPLVRGCLAAVMLLALASCTESSPSAEPAEPPAPTTDPMAASLHPPGTELDDGLVVPEGTMLAGSIFRGSNLDSILGGWGALLTTEGDDPFALFDAMATQVREAGLPMPGSAAACLWLLDRDQEDDSSPTVAAAADGDPGAPILLLLCRAGAWDPANGIGPTEAELTLTWGPDNPGGMWLEASSGPFHNPEQGRGWYGETGGPDSARGPSGAAQDPHTAVASSDPVDPSILDVLPDRAPLIVPEPGDAFGAGANCFADRDLRFTLPDGTRMVATDGGPDGHSVLVADDVDAAMDALFAQAGEPSELELSPDTQVTLPDGEVVARRGWGTRGGGGCEVLASTDGNHVLISMLSA